MGVNISKLVQLLKNSINPAKLDDLDKLSTDQLLALMRHEAHRIEKTIYNQILEEKYDTYKEKWTRIRRIHRILHERKIPDDEPTIAWSRGIYDAFEDLEEGFIRPGSKPSPQFDPEAINKFVKFLRSRRSVRMWADEQPTKNELKTLSIQLIDAARWAPTSGNRQPWRFKVVVESERKELLRGLKEEHCISAPLLVFVGMDSRVYGALGQEERGVYIDAGAAIMQMTLAAHSAGYGTCWNHFADDLVMSRKSNVAVYNRFCKELGISEYVTPIAIVAIGRPAFIPPVPARMDIHSLILPDPGSEAGNSHG